MSELQLPSPPIKSNAFMLNLIATRRATVAVHIIGKRHFVRKMAFKDGSLSTHQSTHIFWAMFQVDS